MSVCQRCNSKLVTEGLLPGQQYRCAKCQAVTRLGESEKVPVNKLAWRSLWLGLASIVLIFLTGIPAVYYGVKSLLRMRFVKSKRGDRAAAVVGTTLGGFFGIFIGGFVATIFAVWLFGYLNRVETEEPDQVVVTCQQIFDFVPPDGILPVKANSVVAFKQHAFDFADEKQLGDRSARIHLKFLGSTMKLHEEQLVHSLSGINVWQPLGPAISTEILQWEMLGQPIEVKKTIYETLSGDDQSMTCHQYFGLGRTDHGYYGAVVVFEPESFELDELQVQKIFADLMPAKQKLDSDEASSSVQPED